MSVQKLFTHDFVLLPDGEIIVPEGENQISGSAVLKSGKNEIFIPNTKVTARSKIFLTPTVLTSKSLVVIDKKEGLGFTVGITGKTQVDIYFDWFIVGAYSPTGASPPFSRTVTRARYCTGSFS